MGSSQISFKKNFLSRISPVIASLLGFSQAVKREPNLVLGSFRFLAGCQIIRGPSSPPWCRNPSQLLHPPTASRQHFAYCFLLCLSFLCGHLASLPAADWPRTAGCHVTKSQPLRSTHVWISMTHLLPSHWLSSKSVVKPFPKVVLTENSLNHQRCWQMRCYLGKWVKQLIWMTGTDKAHLFVSLPFYTDIPVETRERMERKQRQIFSAGCPRVD